MFENTELKKIPKPALLKEVDMCENCEECYGFIHTIIADDIFIQCELSKINTSISSGYGLVYKYNKAIEVLETVGMMFAEIVMSCIKPVIPDIEYYIDGRTVQINSDTRKGSPGSKDKVYLSDKLNNFFNKRYKDVDILFDFDSFFGVWVTKEEWKGIEKELKKEFR